MLQAKKIEKPDLLSFPFYGYSIKKKQKKKNYYLKLNHINKVMKNICKINKNKIDEFVLPQITIQRVQPREQKFPSKNVQKKLKTPGFSTIPEEEKQNVQKNKCMLKKINGELKELNNLDTCKILKNYIPYTKTSKFNIFNDSPQKHVSYKYYDLNNFEIIPTIYQTQNCNTDLIKKCRQASKNTMTDISKYCKCSKKEMKKIKESLNNNLYLSLSNQQNELSKYLTYPREKIQRLICSNQNQKKKITNSNSWMDAKENIYNSTCINESKSMIFQMDNQHSQIFQPDAHKTADWVPEHDKEQKSSHTNICIKPQKNATAILLNHSRNMLISKIKNTKNELGPLETKKKEFISTSPNLKHSFLNYNKLNKMQNISNNAHNNYNKTFIYPKNKLSEKKKKNFKDYEQNLTIQKLLCQTDRIKSVEKKNYIEKINQYKVIYKGDDFVSIYKNKENKNIDNHNVDLASLLCKPGYVGDYLYKSNSTNNNFFDNTEKNKIFKNELVQSVQIKNEEPNLCFVKNNLQIPKYYNLNRSSKINNIHEQCQTNKNFNNQFLNKQNDEILQNMTKAINSSPTLNLDLQYITFFIELLKNQKKQNLIL